VRQNEKTIDPIPPERIMLWRAGLNEFGQPERSCAAQAQDEGNVLALQIGHPCITDELAVTRGLLGRSVGLR